ncbi:MAG TPA: hypothetical protein VNX67_10295 [Solirubrobacteraceae bacterium]|jgi:hypothetical protein|nr:hypothetical protein [Solirubrobacteraceae bacterium]
MRQKIVGTVGAVALALGVMSASAWADPNPPGGGDCHADQLQFYKGQARTNNAEATADFFNVTVQSGQEIISTQCGKS